MDSKSKANFINSVADGKVIPCTVCGTENDSNDKNCTVCGSKLISKIDLSKKDEKTAFNKIDNDASEVNKDKEQNFEKSILADGLPSWDIMPPQVVVRRR